MGTSSCPSRGGLRIVGGWAIAAAVAVIVLCAAVRIRSDGVEGSLFDFSRRRLPSGTRDIVPTILLLGDSGCASPELRANMRAMAHERALLAVHTGDVSYHGPLEYPRFLDAVDDLPFPLFAIPGDHDRDLDPKLDLYDRDIGGRDRVVEVGGVRLVLLDSSTEGILEPSFEFLAKTLAAPTQSKWTIVATHCPPFEPTADGGRLAFGAGHVIRSAEEAKRLLSMLAAAGVDLLACGHIHAFHAAHEGGVPIVITGGGGRSVEPGAAYHYVRVVLTDPISIEEVVTTGAGGREPIGRLCDSVVALLLRRGPLIASLASAVLLLVVMMRFRRVVRP